jgi:hypothetical protein
MYAVRMPATKYEIRDRAYRGHAVRTSVLEKIAKPWWGSYTELLDVLRPLPPHRRFNPQALSAMLSDLESNGSLDGWTLRRWRTPKSRMIALVPPGWVWDDEAKRWFLHGTPV